MPRPVGAKFPTMLSVSRVERWRGGLGSAYLSVSRPFVCGCLTSVTVPRFHLPLVKPDVRISRIRLSYKDSWVRPRNAAIAQAESDKSELIMQAIVRVT